MNPLQTIRTSKAEDVGRAPIQAAPPVPPPLPAKKKQSFAEIEVVILRVVAIIVSTFSTGMSVYFSFAWFSDRMHSIGAMIMAIIIVSCITLAPQFIIILLKKKRIMPSVAAVLIALIAIPSGLFSMGTTIGGIYNQRSKTISERAVSTLAADTALAQIKVHQDKVARAEAVIENATAAERDYLQRYSDLKDFQLGGRTETLLLDRLDLERSKIIEAEYEIATNLAKIEELNAQKKPIAVRDDFYTWIAARTGWTVDNTELILAAFPAVFIDVVAPTMLAVALFL